MFHTNTVVFRAILDSPVGHELKLIDRIQIP